MTKLFYEWEDAGDPYAIGVPDLQRYEWARCTTLAQVRREWKEYLEDFPNLGHTPKLRVWEVGYKTVKVKV